jgi:hypothetical protein
MEKEYNTHLSGLFPYHGFIREHITQKYLLMEQDLLELYSADYILTLIVILVNQFTWLRPHFHEFYLTRYSELN